ncbi:MAG: signal peptidase II [Candidatus Eisenbacteria bacterium]|uniref:Lipoprotein signal peptidase n=1 Tax=Eiseniibacteriota bacterium TaxID=2212470 RepID=A0A538U3J1_UNCEI|nr:MAG: signal peptidase II [Candidatus Eisenbacteria bacterium]
MRELRAAHRARAARGDALRAAVPRVQGARGAGGPGRFVSRAWARLALISGAVLVLDLWTKHWATRALAFQEPVEILGPFLRFTYTRNSGVAFGLGAGLPFPYYVFSIAAVIVIVTLFVRQRVTGLSRQIALALIMGGALGNLIDRLRFGEVVDFIEIGYGRWHWPVFNVADSAVTIGVILFAITWPRPQGDKRDADTDLVGAGDRSGEEAGSLPGRGADGPVA